MAAAHNTVIKKLLHDFGALPAELVAKYLTIMFGESMTLPLANQTIYAAVREFVCYQKDGYLLANSFVKIDSKIESGRTRFLCFPRIHGACPRIHLLPPVFSVAVGIRCWRCYLLYR